MCSKEEELLEDQGSPDHHDGVGGPFLFGRAFSTCKNYFTSNSSLITAVREVSISKKADLNRTTKI